MMTGVTFLTVMVLAALAITAAAPILLIAFLVRDWRNGELW